MNAVGYESLKLSLISSVNDGEGAAQADDLSLPVTHQDSREATQKNLYLFEVSNL